MVEDPGIRCRKGKSDSLVTMTGFPGYPIRLKLIVCAIHRWAGGAIGYLQ
jgi:hypothetical protein